MSEQVNNTEKNINTESSSEVLVRILKKTMRNYNFNMEDKLDILRVLQDMSCGIISLDREMFEFVINMLDQDEAELASEAALVLYSIELTEMQVGRSIQTLVSALKRDRKKGSIEKNIAYEYTVDSLLKINTALALSKIGNRAVPALSELLSSDQEKTIRIWAAHIIGMIGQDAEGAVKYLLEFIDNADEDIKFSYAITLSKFRVEQKKVFLILESNMKNKKDKLIKIEIANAIGNLGESVGKDALPYLISLLSDEEVTVRNAAMQSLLNIKYIAEPTAPLYRRATARPYCCNCPPLQRSCFPCNSSISNCPYKKTSCSCSP